MAHGRPDHTGSIYVTGSVTIPIAIASSAVTIPVSIESSDVTFNVHITASDVVFQATVTASEIMMPVDIQAQYITLDVGIVASSVTLNVNITASAVTLNVAITSSAVTLNVAITSSAVTLNIAIQSSAVTLDVNVTNATIAVTGSVTITGAANVTITAQTVGVSIQGEWQTQQGFFKYGAGGGSLAPDAKGYISYTPPSGKNLYIYGCTFCTRSLYTGGDNPQEMACELDVAEIPVVVAVVAEAQETVFLQFTSPIRVPGTLTLKLYSTNIGTTNGGFLNSWWGYEV
jgi:hypothetical protein